MNKRDPHFDSNMENDESKPNLCRMVLTAIVAVSIVALICSQVILAFANPLDAVPPANDGSVRIMGSNSSSQDRDPDDNAVGLDDDSHVRDEQGIVSQLSTDTHNPYNGQIRLDIDVGSEFAEFEGSDITEGIRIKVSPGGIVELPALRARDGYYFVGWNQGGVPYEPTWDPFTTEVEMGTDTSKGKNTTIFAIYADEQGNGYCTCGSYEQGIYSTKLDEIKAINDEYNDILGYKASAFPTWSIALMFVLCICIVILVAIAARKANRDREERAAKREALSHAPLEDASADNSSDDAHGIADSKDGPAVDSGETSE